MGMRIPNKEERGVTRGRQWLRKKRGRGIGGQNTRNGDKKLSSTEKCTLSSLPRIPPPADILLEFSLNIRLTEVFLAKTGE